MKLSKQRGIYSYPGKWEMIGRRARKARMSISRFGVLCCLRAASESDPSPLPPGHALVLPEDEQRRHYENMRALSRSGRFVISAPGGGKATVLIHEAVRFLLLSEEGQSG